MKITEFTKRVCKAESKKKQVDIAQMSETIRVINKLTGGILYAVIRMLPILVFVFLSFFSFAQTYTPRNYWHFDGVNPANAIDDSLNNLNLVYGSGFPITSGGQVGKYGTLGAANGLVTMHPDFSIFKDSFAFEFMIKPGYLFNNCRFINTTNGSVAIDFVWPKDNFSRPGIRFYTQKNNGQVDDFFVTFDGINRKNWGYLMDGGWHHFVFQYNCQTGKKEIWIDGQLPVGFSTTTATGGSIVTGGTLYLNWSVNYVKIFADLDEIATYTRTLPGIIVKEHYNNMVAGDHYSFTTSLTSVGTAAPVSGPVDANDYPVGSQQINTTWTVPAGSSGPDGQGSGSSVSMPISAGATRNFIEQIKWYPRARFKTGHSMPPNIDVCNIEYAAGGGQTIAPITSPTLYTQITQAQKVANAKEISIETAQNWNMALSFYNINGKNASDFGSVANTYGMMAKLANDSSHFPASAGAFRIQLPGSLIWSLTLANDQYLQNSSGTKIAVDGRFRLRPTVNPANYVGDGNQIRSTLQALIAALPNRSATKKLDQIWENGEWYPVINQATGTQDPVVNAAYLASGLDWYTFSSRKYKELAKNSYPDVFLSLPGLQNTRYAEYALDGQFQWRYKWSEVRQINTPQVDGDYMSTGDFYPRWPHNWRNWSTAWHGLKWFSISRAEEIGAGDEFFAPFVSAGWYPDEEKNMRPGQYLGLLKILNGMGAKYFYNSYFGNLGNPFALPPSWAYQYVLPCYAQAAVSRHYADFYNSKVLPGDVPQDYVAGTDSSLFFQTGDLRKIVTVRKVNGVEKYLIFGTLQNNTNMLDTLSIAGNATITIPGAGQLKFQVRRQGSVYYFDNTNPSAKIFYQLDGWHEMSHPDRWSQDLIHEAELNETTNSTIATTGISGTDYTGAVSYASLNNGQTITFKIQRTEQSSSTRYFWVRARSKNGSDCGITITGIGSSKSIECITNTSWAWYRVDKISGVPIQFTSMTSGAYTLTLTAINGIDIDKIALIESSGNTYGASTTTCAGSVTASITPSGSTTLCSSAAPLTLTASAGTTYLWSTGATTQAISVNTSGTYTVTVTVAGVGSDDASVAVTVNGSPVISPIANVSNTCPADSLSFSQITVVNTGTAGTLTWHSSLAAAIAGTGALSDSVGTTGKKYARIVTGASCYDVDSVLITINDCSCATPPTVYAGADKTICAGSTSTMTGTKGVGTGTVTWSGGAGSFSNPNSLTAIYYPGPGDITAGFVNLVLSTPDPDAGGPCTAASDTVKVTITSLPTIAITASGATSFCQGGSVSLSAPSGYTYLWSTAATTQSIAVTTTGTYTVTVTSNGCTKTASSTVTVFSNPNVSIFPFSGSVCVQGTVTFSASSGNSFLWNTGATTQTITPNTPGSYTVTVTNANGCSGSFTASIIDTCAGSSCVAPYNLNETSVTFWSARSTFLCSSPANGFTLYLKNTVTNKTITANYSKSTRTINMWGLRGKTTYQYWIVAKCSTGNKTSVVRTFKTK
jgi:hypothetical protein